MHLPLLASFGFSLQVKPRPPTPRRSREVLPVLRWYWHDGSCVPTAATGNNDVTNSGVFRDDSDVISTQHMPDVRVGRVQSAFLRDRCQQAGGGGGGGGGMRSGMHRE